MSVKSAINVRLKKINRAYEVWRTRFFVCWPSSLELATRWSASNTNDKQFQTQAQDLPFHLCF